MREFWPGWMTAEIEAALRRIDAGGRTKDTGKKLRTVLVVADGLAQGQSMGALLRRPDTCASSTWYGKSGRLEKAWRVDEGINAALELCKAAAVRWESAKVARALESAHERLALEARDNVLTMIRARDGLIGIGAEGEGERERVLAYREAAEVAGGMLDRAGQETADKSGGELKVRFVRPKREMKGGD